MRQPWTQVDTGFGAGELWDAVYEADVLKRRARCPLESVFLWPALEEMLGKGSGFGDRCHLLVLG